MARNLLILGAGQYGLLAAEVARAMGCFDKIDFLDDHSPYAIGRTGESTRFFGTYTEAFVAIGNSAVRLGCIRRLAAEGFALPVLRHPAAVVMPSAQLGDGCIVEPMAVVSANTVVETGCLICAGAVVNHNAHVEPGCQIDCNATVPSNSTVPAGTKLCCGQVFCKSAE